jgi:type VII secretion-associated serine protease mycosin
MMRAAAAAVLVAGLVVVPAPMAFAACQPPPAVGQPIPPAAGRDPMIDRLGLPRVKDLSTGAGVTVAVVDSGVDSRHPKLAPAVIGGLDLAVVNDPRIFTESPGTPEDCQNHGTMIAGLIAARPLDDDRVVGVAPDAKIAAIRMVGTISDLPDQLIAQAIRDGADRGSVLNLSFALPVDRPAVKAAVQYALSKDVVVVAAAGNEQQSQPGQTWYPAAYEGVLAVAAVDNNGAPIAQSNQGPWVGIAAPGSDLTSTAAGGSRFLTQSGTSFATAIVSGVAALVRSRFPGLSGPAVVQRLISTAVPVAGSRDDKVGAGVVDPFAALTAPVVAPSTSDHPVGTVAVLPRPAEDEGFGPVLRTALAWAGGLALAGLLALVGGIAFRRAALRRWRPGGRDDVREKPTSPEPTEVELL